MRHFLNTSKARNNFNSEYPAIGHQASKSVSSACKSLLIQPRAFSLSMSPSDIILALNFTIIQMMGSSALGRAGLKHFFSMISTRSSRYIALSQACLTLAGKHRICLQCSGVGRKSLVFILDSGLLTSAWRQ